jgi:hypothetical protein
LKKKSQALENDWLLKVLRTAPKGLILLGYSLNGTPTCYQFALGAGQLFADRLYSVGFMSFRNEDERGVNTFERSFFFSHRVTNSTFHLALKSQTSKNDAMRREHLKERGVVTKLCRCDAKHCRIFAPKRPLGEQNN